MSFIKTLKRKGIPFSALAIALSLYSSTAFAYWSCSAGPCGDGTSCFATSTTLSVSCSCGFYDAFGMPTPFGTGPSTAMCDLGTVAVGGPNYILNDIYGELYSLTPQTEWKLFEAKRSLGEKNEN